MSRPQNKVFYTVNQVAERIQQSEKAIRRKLKAGILPFHKFGKSIRIGDGDLDEYIQRCRSS
jgi:excisionase family DNA binding protein